MKKKIAVIGGGIAGIGVAYLLQEKYEITIYEAANYLGGHTNTYKILNGPDAGVGIDTGFIVLNNRTYPNLHHFFSKLGVEVRESNMSFGFCCEDSGLEYSGNGLRGIFAQPSNLLNLSFWQMILGILNFSKVAFQKMQAGKIPNLTLREYILENKIHSSVVEKYILPLSAAIWSTPANDMLDFPAETFFRFFHNHGLLNLKDRPRWQTVVGGSSSYVEQFKSQFEGQIILNTAVKRVLRDGNQVTLILESETLKFDEVVIATHADQALKILESPSTDEKKALSSWHYQNNHITLHTDESVMPSNKNAWASWNYRNQGEISNNKPLSVTYYMNLLQGLSTTYKYFVTLNGAHLVSKNTILTSINYEHPLYLHDSLESQKLIRQLNGRDMIWYCGSYFGFGFHEDAFSSALEIARAKGINF